MSKTNHFRALIMAQVLSVPLLVIATLYLPSYGYLFTLIGLTIFFIMIAGYYFGRNKVHLKDRGPYLLAQLIASLAISIPLVWGYSLAHAANQQAGVNCVTQEQTTLSPTGTLEPFTTGYCNPSLLQADLSPSSIIYILVLYNGIPAAACYTYYLSGKRVYGQKKERLFV